MTAMRLTVLGCSGSVTGPDSPASGYLLTADGAPPVVVDFGGGVLGALQRHVDPRSVDVLLSHLHADHCLDVPGLLVWRRFGPGAPPPGQPCERSKRAVMYGPSDTAHRIGVASAETGGEVDDMSDTIDLRPWRHGEEVTVGALSVVPMRVCHPPESFGLRITAPDGAVLVYSGDTSLCEDLVGLARGADVFLCEASWTHAPELRPPGLHMSGAEAGRAARRAGVGRLLLTHIPPWTAREDVLAEARSEFDGPVDVVLPDDTFAIAAPRVGSSPGSATSREVAPPA